MPTGASSGNIPLTLLAKLGATDSSQRSLFIARNNHIMVPDPKREMMANAREAGGFLLSFSLLTSAPRLELRSIHFAEMV